MQPMVTACRCFSKYTTDVKPEHFSPNSVPARYRRAIHLRRRRSWTRAIVAKMCWIVLVIEERFQVVAMAKMLLSFLLALLLAPPALCLYMCLKTIRATGRFLFHWYFPDLRLVSSDSLRLTLDTKRNPSMVTLMVMLQGRIGLEELQRKVLTEIVEKRKAGRGTGPQSPHLKMRLKTKLGCPVWERDNYFDITKHVTMASGRWHDRPISEANLQDFITEQCSHPLPLTMSPWQVLLISLQSTDLNNDSVCVLIRLHHLVSEGMTPGRLFRSVLATGDELPAGLPATKPLQSFQAIPETYSVFAKRSATKQTFCQILDQTQTTISSVRSKCDPSDPRDDLNVAWHALRKILQGVQHFFGELQKLYEMTDPQCAGRSAWYRAGTLVYFLPRLLGSFDRLWTFSFLDLSKQFLMGLLQLPSLLLQFCCLAARSAVSGLVAGVTEVQLFLRSSRPIYIMLNDAFREIRETLQTIVLAPSIILNEFLKRSDHYPLLRHSGSGRKAVAWSEPLPLETVKAVKEASGATTNEVLVSLCAGALTQYFRAMGVDVPENIMTTIPVYSKDFVDASETSGDGFVTLSLPTDENDAMECLATTQQRMRGIRNSPSKYLVSVALLRYLGNFLPDFLVGILIKFLSRQYLMIMANISISAPMTAWSREVKTVCYWRPPQANTALSLSLVTYNNQVTLMAMTNQDVMSHPQILTISFVKEFNGLARMLGVQRRRQPRRLSAPALRVFTAF